jgi:hypothetical protein
MKSLYQSIVDYFQKVNWMLLLFLVLMLNVKMSVKIIAIILFLLLNRKMFFEKTISRQRFIWFYYSMIIITVINLFLNISSISANYFLAAALGIIFWLLCAAAVFLNSWFVAKTDTAKLHNTITFFFILNAVVTIGQLLFIMWDAGSINPYVYQGMHQKYFATTGDLITGITFDVSTTNAILNTFGVIYFLHRSKMHMALFCMAILLLTVSNFTNILFAFILFFIFIFQSNRDQKSVIVICLFLFIVFTIKISPPNNSSLTDAYKRFFNIKTKPQATEINNVKLSEKPDNILNPEERKQKIAMLYLDSLYKVHSENKRKMGITMTLVTKPFIPKPSIHSEPFQRNRDTTLYQKKLLAFAINNIPAFDTDLEQVKARKLPGKLLASQQTFNFFRQHPLKIISGAGAGNFSSKLAFRTTGLQMAGGYPEKNIYINKDFLDNHLNLYLTYFSKDKELHSLINSPDSVYDQLIAEYGLAGIFSFIFLYIAFFVKRMRELTYGIPLLLMLLGVLGVGYWFEQLSIIIFFELLMLLNIKETKQIK